MDWAHQLKTERLNLSFKFWYVPFTRGISGKGSACQCRRSKRCGFDLWVGKIPWRRAWQPTPVVLPGKSHGQRILAEHSPWGSQTVRHDEQLNHHHHVQAKKVQWTHGRSTVGQTMVPLSSFMPLKLPKIRTSFPLCIMQKAQFSSKHMINGCPRFMFCFNKKNNLSFPWSASCC